MDEDELQRRAELIQALLSLAVAAWMLWTMVPEHRRREWRMRLLLAGRKMTGTCARRAGAASMRAELATGQPEYTVTYGLSLAREWLARAYDRTRGVTL